MESNTGNIDVNQLNQLNQIKQIEEMKKQLLSKILTRDAHERLSRVRMVNSQLAGEVDLYLLQIYQAGKLQNPISDEKLKEVLGFLSQKKEMNIKRR
jgi:programmed cell death protein 5